MSKPPEVPAPPGKKWIFIKAFKHAKSGKIIRAVDYGKEAFRILVRVRAPST